MRGRSGWKSDGVKWRGTMTDKKWRRRKEGGGVKCKDVGGRGHEKSVCRPRKGKHTPDIVSDLIPD